MILRALAVVLAATVIAASGAAPVSSEEPRRSGGDVVATGDAMAGPLPATAAGDPARGRHIVLDREVGNCLICHKVPEPAELFQGDLGPDLRGIGKRLTAGQIRLRLVDQSRLNPQTMMPPYHRVDGLNRVAARYRGKPLLTAQEVEDVVAYLETLTQ
jgi:sulfur-oxidizing protein SoxX